MRKALALLLSACTAVQAAAAPRLTAPRAPASRGIAGLPPAPPVLPLNISEPRPVPAAANPLATVSQALAAATSKPDPSPAQAQQSGQALEDAMTGAKTSVSAVGAAVPDAAAAAPLARPGLRARLRSSRAEIADLFRGDPQIHPFIHGHPEQRRNYWTSSALLVLNAFAGVALAHAVGRFTDLALAGAQVDGALAALILATGAILTMKAGQIALDWTYLIVQRGTAGLIRDVRRHLVDHLATLSLGFFHRHGVQDLAPRIVADVSSLTTRNWEIPIGMPYLLVRGALSFGMLAAADWRIALAAVPTLYVFNRIAVYFGKKLEAIAETRAAQRARTVGRASEAFSMIEVHKIFGSEAAAAASVKKAVDELAETGRKETRTRADNTAANGLVTFVIGESLFFIGAWLLFLHGWPSLGALMAMQAYASGVQYSITSVTGNRTKSREAAGATRRVLQLLAEKPELADGTHELGPLHGRVRFENAGFSYDGAPVLKGLTFEVEPGQTVAFVGATGSGKTTILRLLARLYDPTSGSVSVDGKDLRTVKLASFTRQLAVVPQNESLLSGSIRENLLAVQPGATDEQLRRALVAADAAFVFDARAFPEGLETEVGERGARLSGGQRQRLAIARAVLRNPRILLLDEATSALDNESEARVQSALRGLMTGRTTFIIAHRLTTVQDADRIFVLDGGAIVESGTHAELLAKRGKYHRLWSAKGPS